MAPKFMEVTCLCVILYYSFYVYLAFEKISCPTFFSYYVEFDSTDALMLLCSLLKPASLTKLD